MKPLVMLLFCLMLHSTVGKFINKKVARKLDISSHLVKMTTTIAAENSGDDSIYVFNIDSGFEDSVSFIGAMVSKIFCIKENVSHLKFHYL